jgi:hypothetical protein
VTLNEFDSEYQAVKLAFPGSALLDVPGQRLIRLPGVAFSEPWSPSRVRAMLICDAWPGQRPRLLVGDELLRNNAAPANFNRELIAGEAWFGFSFNAPYSSTNPSLVPVIRGWLRRFDGRPD